MAGLPARRSFGRQGQGTHKPENGMLGQGWMAYLVGAEEGQSGRGRHGEEER